MVGTQALLVDGERAAHQGLGLAEPVGALQQQGQVVEGSGILTGVSPVTRLHSLDIALSERDRLAVPTRLVKLDNLTIERVEVLGLRGCNWSTAYYHHRANHE